VYKSADFYVSRGFLMGRYAYCDSTGMYLLANGDKAGRKWDLIGARPIIMLVVLAGLGGNLSVALNALDPVLTAGSGGASLRSRLVGSLDATSIIV
jgi:hypothetical protein